MKFNHKRAVAAAIALTFTMSAAIARGTEIPWATFFVSLAYSAIMVAMMLGALRLLQHLLGRRR